MGIKTAGDSPSPLTALHTGVEELGPSGARTRCRASFHTTLCNKEKASLSQPDNAKVPFTREDAQQAFFRINGP